MNPLDQLELDILAATGDIEAAETARLLAQALTEDLLEVGIYIMGFTPAISQRIWRERT